MGTYTVLKSVTLIVFVSVAGIAVGFATAGGLDSGEPPMTDTPTPQCTDASVTSYTWDPDELIIDQADEHRVTLVNQHGYAGTVTITVSFYTGGKYDGSATHQVAIGGQSTKDVTFRAEPPRGYADSAYAAVTSQSCITAQIDPA